MYKNQENPDITSQNGMSSLTKKNTPSQPHSQAHGHHVHIDYEGDKYGMWLFLYSEILLFGGLFLLYAIYLSRYTPDFIEGAKHLNLIMGSINTIILLISSFAVAASITAIRRNNRKGAILWLSSTMIIAVVFIINKYFEWGAKISHGLYPNSPELLEMSHGSNLFYGLYYTVTGLHGLHVIIGASALMICVIKLFRKTITSDNYIWLENAGLYWHLVDLIWIFVFPLFYLVV